MARDLLWVKAAQATVGGDLSCAAIEFLSPFFSHSFLYEGEPVQRSRLVGLASITLTLSACAVDQSNSNDQAVVCAPPPASVIASSTVAPKMGQSEWFFRGTPNSWGTTPLDQIGSSNVFETCQTFSGVANPRFKIDHFGDWLEAFPAQDYTVSDNTSYQITFDGDSKAITVDVVSSCGEDQLPPADTWYFRGTSNDWGATAMESLGSDRFGICQTFNGKPDPRFKIDRFGDWSENYPAEDYQVNDNTSYQITFDASDKSLTAEVVSSCDGVTPPPPADKWYFRGTPNDWAATEMTQVGSGTTYETCQTFTGVADPRFKVDHHADWTESYPAEDYQVEDEATYHIAFDAAIKEVSVTQVDSCDGEPPPKEENWVLRSTASGWCATALTPVDGTSELKVTVSFAKEDPAPRFKIDRYGDWSESYPAEPYAVTDCKRYEIVFDVDSKSVQVTEVGDVTTGNCAGEPPPSAVDFREETIYFLLTARFYDGDESNNYYNRDRIKPGGPAVAR